METLDEIKEKIKNSTDNEYILESLKANEKLQADRDVIAYGQCGTAAGFQQFEPPPYSAVIVFAPNFQPVSAAMITSERKAVLPDTFAVPRDFLSESVPTKNST